MEKLNIMTWNTQLYEMGNKIGRLIKPIDNIKFMSIINVIKGHLEKENSIAFLQEIPYHDNIKWKEHLLFKKFEDFFQNDYDIIWNVHTKHQIMMTVVLAKKGVIDRDSKGHKDNRCVSVTAKCNTKDLRIMGIHAKNQKNTKNYLVDIKKHFPSYYNIIVGDFNAGNYLKSNEDSIFKENRKSYIDFTEGYIDVCQGEITTEYFTQIDHILIKNTKKHKRINYSFKIDDEIKNSDHYPIFCEIEYEEDDSFYN